MALTVMLKYFLTHFFFTKAEHSGIKLKSLLQSIDLA